MKKVLSVMAVSAFVLTAGVAFAGGPGKKAASCPEPCQQQIDDLNSSQAQQNEQLSAHGKQLQNHEGRIKDLEKAFDNYWYGRIGLRAAWMSMDLPGQLGGTNIDGDGNTGFGGAVAFGHDIALYQSMGRMRAEVEFAYQGADLDDTNVDAYYGLAAGTGRMMKDSDYSLWTVMLNGYYELPVADEFSFYFMAGLGYAQINVTAKIYDAAGNYLNSAIDDSDNAFAYKAGLGMTYNFTDTVAGDLGYEYLGVADTDVAESINGHSIVASVRFKF